MTDIRSKEEYAADMPLACSVGARKIAEERQQQLMLGYTPRHDSGHTVAEFTAAARAYLDHKPGHRTAESWPWEPESFKPSADPSRNLEKAGALIAAAIDMIHQRRGTR